MQGEFSRRVNEAKKVNLFNNARSIIRASSGSLAFAETEVIYLSFLGKRLEEHTNARLDKIRTTW